MDLKILKIAAQDIKVLYVEDSLSVREAFFAYLKKFFKNIDLRSDGIEGLEAYKKNKYDIVITDVDMPKMNGIDMSKEIKTIDDEQHIIIVSAYKKIENYIEAIKLGVDGYILKPIDFEQVNQVLIKTVNQINGKKFNDVYKNNLKEMLDRKTKEIKKQYITDRLTGLKNKALLDKELSFENEKTLILLNINNFSIYYNNFGSSFCDRVLIKVSNILKKYESDIFSLYRLESDVFVFLCEGNRLNESLVLAKTISSFFNNNSLEIRGISIFINFSISIDSSSKRDLLKSTSISLHESKEYKKGFISIYSENSEFEKNQLKNLNMIEKIRKLSLEDSIIIYIQPIKDVRTNKIDKYEVLARLKNSDGTILPPATFLKPIQLAGLSSIFTKIIIDKSFKEFSSNSYNFSINLTESDLTEKYLEEYLDKKIKEYNIDPSRVILEILETVSTTNNASVIENLVKLHKKGFKLAIDDFGSENSNFSRLLTLEVDYIKIDGSFIRNIGEDINSKEIVKAITSFSHNIGCKVIAEFVHNQQVYDISKEFDIDYVQGYFIAEPSSNYIE